jgi:hypothetical protein
MHRQRRSNLPGRNLTDLIKLPHADAWARKPYACVIFNLLTFHTSSGIEASARSFCGLIDLAIARGGSYYLTYHKFAKPEQVVACYPQFKQFLDLKRKYDPAELFQSEWYRYYRKLFASS